MTDSAPATNTKPRLLTIVLLPSKHDVANDEDNRRHVYEVCYPVLIDRSAVTAYHWVRQEVNMLVPSRQKDINNENNGQCEVSYPVLDVVYHDSLPLGLLTGRVCGVPA